MRCAQCNAPDSSRWRTKKSRIGLKGCTFKEEDCTSKVYCVYQQDSPVESSGVIMGWQVTQVPRGYGIRWGGGMRSQIGLRRDA